MEVAIAKFLTWQFAAAAVATMALITLLKKMLIKAKKEELLAKPWFQAYILTPLPLIIGFGIGLIPKFLPGDVWYHQVVLGVGAGFLSQFLYHVFKKRLDPSGEIPNSIAPQADSVKPEKEPKYVEPKEDEEEDDKTDDPDK